VPHPPHHPVFSHRYARTAPTTTKQNDAKTRQARKRYGGRIKFHFEAPCADVAVPAKTATFEIDGASLGGAQPAALPPSLPCCAAWVWVPLPRSCAAPRRRSPLLSDMPPLPSALSPSPPTH